ncbi:TetR/AcrR family transcriptional regulator [Desulfosporosinus sp. SB140]|uniref:TetR/AcrR family transcriptional regulator n=1 Tax=Desulfosporosinus paludis TaxID=3115649 RepID=UPI003890365D
MARIIKKEDYNAKRNEILDIALKLIYSKGYEKMSIQDILDGLQISKGAFYHYFDSKQALLEALVERAGKEAAQSLLPIVKDPNLSALQKFRRYFELSINWKTMQKDLIIKLLSVWYSDENAIIRQKMISATLKQTPGFFEPIIRQGIEEKVFTTFFPEQAAIIITGIALNLADTLTDLWLSPTSDSSRFTKTDMILDAYFDSIERILGAPSGSLKCFGADAFKDWLTEEQSNIKSK